MSKDSLKVIDDIRTFDLVACDQETDVEVELKKASLLKNSLCIPKKASFL